MYILQPDTYLIPSYRLSPFQTVDVAFNRRLSGYSTLFDTYAANRFENWQMTINGREAIALALQALHLGNDDVVTILTTSQNHYISSCVTSEIEKVCQWNRALTQDTAAILVNHEFGTVYQDMESLIATGIPIIEDCCTTFFSQDDKGGVGRYGHFAVYSFPKFFPIQIGGLLVTNGKIKADESAITQDSIAYVKNVVGYYLQQVDLILEQRKQVYELGVRLLIEKGFAPYFNYADNQYPSVLMVNNRGIIQDLLGLKLHLWQHGIQSSVFYGKDAFFMPVHQRLQDDDLQYFFHVINAYKA